MSKTTARLLMLTALTVFMMPRSAKADIVYTFITLTCDSSSHFASIRVFYSDDQDASLQEKHTYSLDTIGATKPQKYGKRITCALGDGETVAFATHEGDVPKHDSLKLFFDEARFHRALDSWGGYNLGYGGLTLYIKAIRQNWYLLKYCPDSPWGLSDLGQQQIDEFAAKHEKKCEAVHVSNGTEVGKETIVNP